MGKASFTHGAAVSVDKGKTWKFIPETSTQSKADSLHKLVRYLFKAYPALGGALDEQTTPAPEAVAWLQANGHEELWVSLLEPHLSA